MRGALRERAGRRGAAHTLDNAVASALDFSDGLTANGPCGCEVLGSRTT
jgi:hypothetical protein